MTEHRWDGPLAALRQPPANVAAEQALLGGLMVNPRSIHSVLDVLKPDHFADAFHQRLFTEISRRVLAGSIADAVALKTWAEQDPDVPEEGASKYLVSLLSAHIGPGMSRGYAEVIRDAWMRRQIIYAGEEVISDAYLENDEPQAVISAAIAKLEGAFGAELARKTCSLNEAMDAAISAAQEAADRKGPAGLSTGFRVVDEHIGGLEDGTLNVLAGRPGMGKSALGWQWALAAARQGAGVLAVSLEMSGRELGRRALATISGVPVVAMKRGTMSVPQASAMLAARKELDGLPLSIEDGGGLTAAMIDIRARSAHRRHGLGMIMVDHLHIVRPEDADVRNGATWAVGRISGEMKRLAKRHNCPVLLLAQLNRGPESRDDKRPTLTDLRQAGDIEQDADTVGLLYRAEYYLRHEPERGADETPDKFDRRLYDWRAKREAVAGRAELIFAKVRDGAPGTVPLRFCGETTSFEDGP